MNIPPFKEFAIGLTMRAGTILRRNFNDNMKRKVTKKSLFELVTASDIEVHKFMTVKIREQFPDHNFLSEEGDLIDNGSEYTWVVDPLDGTLNYTIGNPFFAVSLTLMEGDTPIIGVTYAPFSHEMFVAEKGRSSRRNERNIRVSKETRMANSVLSYAYFRRDKASRQKSLKVFGEFEDKARSMRHLGCTSLELAYVAAGRLEGVVISPPLRLWDIAAGMLLVEAAGGRITNFEGKEWGGLNEGIVVSNGHIHNQLLQVIKKNRVAGRARAKKK